MFLILQYVAEHISSWNCGLKCALDFFFPLLSWTAPDLVIISTKVNVVIPTMIELSHSQLQLFRNILRKFKVQKDTRSLLVHAFCKFFPPFLNYPFPPSLSNNSWKMWEEITENEWEKSKNQIAKSIALRSKGQPTLRLHS